MDGIALVVGVQQFLDGRPEALPAVFTDLSRLPAIFKKLGLQVRELRNKGENKATKEALMKELDDVIEMVKTQNMRRLVLCISTHGSQRKNDKSGNVEQYVSMYDGRISIQDILNKLADLENVTTLVMVSACSSNPEKPDIKNDPGEEIQLVDDPAEEYQNVVNVAPLSQPTDQPPSIPIHVLPDNCAVWFAATPGRVAYAPTGGGTTLCQMFISAVDKALKQSSTVKLMDVMLSVHRETAERVFKQEFKVVPSFVHNLCSDVEFNTRASDHISPYFSYIS